MNRNTPPRGTARRNRRSDMKQFRMGQFRRWEATGFSREFLDALKPNTANVMLDIRKGASA